MHENEIGKEIISVEIDVHRQLGPGLLESAYEVILSHELERKGLKNERQVRVPIEFNGTLFDEGFRAVNGLEEI